MVFKGVDASIEESCTLNVEPLTIRASKPFNLIPPAFSMNILSPLFVFYPNMTKIYNHE